MSPSEWASALEEFWLSSDEPALLLHIERDLLPEIASLTGVDLSIDEAERSFIGAIRDFQRHKHRPWATDGFEQGVPAEFLLLIAAQVYAASSMASSTDHTDRDYYAQLGKVVGREPKGGNFSHELGSDQRVLWRVNLKAWAASHQKQISLPEDTHGAGRHVRLPKSQAVLRVEDLRQLPLFFRRCGLRTSDYAAIDRIEKTLRRFSTDKEVFPNKWARTVFTNKLKFPLAVRQVSNVLKTWDGRWEIPNSGFRQKRGRKQPLRWWVAINRKRSAVNLKIGQSFQSARSEQPMAFLGYLNTGTYPNGRFLNENLFIGRFDSDLRAYEQVDSF